MVQFHLFEIYRIGKPIKSESTLVVTRSCREWEWGNNSKWVRAHPFGVIKMIWRGTWGAQSVKCLTLDFGSGHDLLVCESETHVGFLADSGEPAWHSVSPSDPPLLTCTHVLSLSLSH